jgi:predicted  nucleic acid-binding Zn-ribbon protein
MSLQQAQLEKRSKELDAQEAFIDAKQKLLDDAPINLKVYEARVKAHEKKLQEATDTIKSETEDFEKAKKDQEHELSQLKVRTTVALNDLTVLNDRISDERTILESVKAESRQIKEEIAKDTKYAQEQEKIVEQSVNEGNQRLLDLQDIHNDLKGKNKLLDGEITSKEREIDSLTVDRDAIAGSLAQLEYDFAEKTKKFEQDIASFNKRVADKATEYKKICKETDEKLALLKGKEEGIITKQDALRLERQELETEKRRFNSTKSLYDV